MSTLKVDTLQDASGNNSVAMSTMSSVATINPSGVAVAWCCIDGTGTVGIRESFNCSSITDRGTGSYSVTLSVTMTSSNFCVVGSGSQSRNNNDNIFGHALRDTSQINLISAQNTSGAKEDSDFLHAAVFGTTT